MIDNMSAPFIDEQKREGAMRGVFGVHETDVLTSTWGPVHPETDMEFETMKYDVPNYIETCCLWCACRVVGRRKDRWSVTLTR